MGAGREREFFIDNLLVRIHTIILIIAWTGLAPWGLGGHLRVPTVAPVDLEVGFP